MSHFSTCTKYASSKENAERSPNLCLLNQLEKDVKLVNYELDSEEEFEDKFGENLDNSNRSDS